MSAWRKLGLLYCPASHGRHPRLLSHAANPLPVHLGGDVFRVFYSGRDEQNRSSVGGVDIDIVERKIIHDHHEPFFNHGPSGSFYADGVSIGNCYEAGGVRYMLFMGWQAPAQGHWRGDIGRLVVSPQLTLALEKNMPFMGIDSVDPISLSYPWVMPDARHGFDMWYGSTVTWDAGNGEMLHQINHASSHDGQHWERHGLCVPYEIGVAQAFSRPTVVGGHSEGFDMWFSYRGAPGRSYRIGHAASGDGREWAPCLNVANLEVSDTGWDSEMVEYPYVFDHGGQRYMLYNGNSFGKTGFGLAILDSQF